MKIRRGSKSLRWGWVGLFALELACGPTPAAESPKVASTSVPSPPATVPVDSTPLAPKPLPQLASGELPPIEFDKTVQGTVVAADQSEEHQTLLVEVPIDGLPPELVRSVDHGLSARVVGATSQSPALLASSETSALIPPSTRAMFQIWVRRPQSTHSPKNGAPASAPATIDVDVYTAAGFRFTGEDRDDLSAYRLEPGYHFRVNAALPAKSSPQPKVLAAYLDALGDAAGDSPASWFFGNQLRARSNDAWEKERATREWANLMRFTTGYDSVEAALVTEQGLRAQLAPAKATVELSSLKGPELVRHEWARMLGAVSGVTPAEPLAALVPAEFYYARARSFAAFQTLVDRVDDIVTPSVRVLERHRQQLDLADRYRLELGLPADELSRVLGPQLVNSLVLTGSDPMLRQGSDLSLILDVPASETLLNVLAVKRAQLSQQRPLTEATWTHAGITVSSHRSEDGSVRQELASWKREDGKVFVLISNSRKAVQRILDTWLGQHPAMARELDFQYMLKRDANVPEDVLVYFGDRFVAEVVSPAQRILDSRRQVAKSELAALSSGSLVFAELYGRLPADSKELTAKPWFGARRSKHASGEPINYDRINGVSSAWGSPARLTSIIDLPVPKRISKEEKAAYEQFAQAYQWQWGERIDPIALRVKLKDGQLDAHLRVLPVVNRGDYDDVLRWSGGGLTTRVPSQPAIAGILAIGAGSPLRELLNGNGRSFLGDKFKLDWLGDWVELGLVDDPAVAEFALQHGRLPEPPNAPLRDDDLEEEDFAKLPFYLALDIKSAAGASLFLTLVREMATGAAPDNMKWGEHGKRGGTTVMRVSVEDVNVYYALTKRRLLVALQPTVLERLLDDLEAESKGATPTASGRGGQLVIDASPRSEAGSLVAQSAFRTVAAWLFEKEVRNAAVSDPWAELLLRGAFGGEPGTLEPENYRAQALRWLGAVPVTADGKAYVMTKAGVEDPERGSPHFPKWPRVPVSSGLVERVLESLVGLRTEVAIDDEPGGTERSLRAQVRLRSRGDESKTTPGESRKQP